MMKTFINNRMGGRQSAISEYQLRQVQSSHPEFKNIKVLSWQEGKALQVEFAVGDAKGLEEWAREYSQLQGEESLFLPVEHSIEKTFACGSGGICRVTYPHYQYLLSDYIARCSGEDILYQREKLWYLLYQLTVAASIFHGRGEKVGDIRPRNIFLNNFERIKVGNNFSWPHETTNYAKAIFQKQPAFLAPEEIKQLSFGHNQPETDFQRAESFSVGVTLLDRAVLCDSADLYNLNICRFDYQKLDERLAKLWQISHLDGVIKQTIEGLCRPDPALRLTCRQIYAWLKGYSQDILNKNELPFAELPPFLVQPQITSSPPHSQLPIPKNMYVQSQVVSEFTGRFTQHQQQQPFRELKARQVISTVVVPSQTQIIPLPPSQAQIVSPTLPLLQPTSDSLSISEDFSVTLKKIQQQLQRSRRMFPS